MAEVQILYVATTNGVVQLVNPGTSRRWRAIGEALAGAEVYAVRASAVDPQLAFAGTNSGLHSTRDGGATWELDRPDIVTALAATEDGVYAGTATGVILTNADDSWGEVHAGPDAVAFLSALPGRRLAAVYKDGKTEVMADGSWSELDLLLPGASHIVASTDDPDNLFLTNQSGLVTRTGARGIEATPSGALVLLAGRSEVLLIGTSGSVYRSDDGGATVNAVEGPTDVRVLISPPRYQDYAYAGTGAGELWLSADRGRTWDKLHEGLAPVRDLSFARVR
jgi:photosystem II stability/assembly factor-like uncharacterized protein